MDPLANPDLGLVCDHLRKFLPLRFPERAVRPPPGDRERNLSVRICNMAATLCRKTLFTADEQVSAERVVVYGHCVELIRLLPRAKVAECCASKEGLSPAEIQMIISLVGSTNGLLQAYHKNTDELVGAHPQGARELIAFLMEHLLPCNEVAKERLLEVVDKLVEWSKINVLTPQIIAQVLLRMKAPSGGTSENVALKEVKTRHPDQCKALENALLDIADQLLWAAREKQKVGTKTLSAARLVTWTKQVGGKATTAVLRLLAPTIGAYVIATINDGLASEESEKLSLLEDLVESWPNETAKATDDVLKEQLMLRVQKDMIPFINALIHENEQESTKLKEIVTEIVNTVTPHLLDMLFDRKANVIQHALLGAYPPHRQGAARGASLGIASSSEKERPLPSGDRTAGQPPHQTLPPPTSSYPPSPATSVGSSSSRPAR